MGSRARAALRTAGVGRRELFANDRTRKWITFHDLRATGITWMAIRGHDPRKDPAARRPPTPVDDGAIHPGGRGVAAGVRDGVSGAAGVAAGADPLKRPAPVAPVSTGFASLRRIR